MTDAPVQAVTIRPQTSLLGVLVTVTPVFCALGLLFVLGREVQTKQAAVQAADAQLAETQTMQRAAQGELSAARAELAEVKRKRAEVERTLVQVKSEVAANPQAQVEGITNALGLPPPSSLEEARRIWNEGYKSYGQGKLAEAERKFLEVKEKYPSYAPTYTSLGNLEYKKKNWETALSYYQQSLVRNPGYAPAHYNVALIMEKLGRPTEGLQAVAHALNYRPGYPDALKAQARLLAAQSKQQAP